MRKYTYDYKRDDVARAVISKYDYYSSNQRKERKTQTMDTICKILMDILMVLAICFAIGCCVITTI